MCPNCGSNKVKNTSTWKGKSEHGQNDGDQVVRKWYQCKSCNYEWREEETIAGGGWWRRRAG